MKRFITQTGLFLIAVSIACLGVLYQADGYTDAFYVKFTVPKQKALIVGSSRAAQGLQPACFKEVLGDGIYNFSFSRIHTPYGQAYLKAIKKKLVKKAEPSTFIVEVNPWSIGKRVDQKGMEIFPEEKSFLGKIRLVSVKPNLEYLLESYNGNFMGLITKKGGNYHNEKLFVNSDGWFEVRLNDDQRRHERRVKETIESYRKIEKEYQGKSKARLEYLEQTIAFLKQRGQVYLVRLPISEAMLKIEEGFMPQFDKSMVEAAKKLEVKYINLMAQNKELFFTDGHHLGIESGKKISRQLAGLIKEFKEQ